MNAFIRIFAIMRKELRQLKRDRITFAMIIGVPIGQILLFGYAINTDVRNLKSAVADQANTHLSREFVSELRETQVLDFRYAVEAPQDLEVDLGRPRERRELPLLDGVAGVGELIRGAAHGIRNVGVNTEPGGIRHHRDADR